MTDRDSRGRSLSSEFARGAFGNVLILGAGALINFLVAVLLSRMLGPTGLGIYAFAVALTTIVSAPVTSALGSVVLRETAGAGARGLPARGREAIAWASRTSIWLLGGVSAGIGIAVAAGVGDISADKATTILAGLLLPVPVALLSVFSGAARGLGRIVIGRVPDLILRPLFFAILVVPVFVWPWFGPLSPVLAMLLQALAALLALAVAVVIVWRALQAQDAAEVAGRTSMSSAWLRSLLPLAVVFGLSAIQSNIDILMLDWYLADDKVGVYRAGSQAGRLFFMITTVIGAVLSPYVASLHAAGDQAALQRLLVLGARSSLAIVLPPFVVAVLFGDWIMARAFGAAFAEGSGVFAIIAGGAVAQGLIGYSAAVLSMTGRERQMILSGAASVLVAIVLNVVLIPRYGMEGAAWATTVAAIVLAALHAAKVKRFYRLRTWALG
jgi:O-antigen/teichoic acid export membrane protein